MNESIGLYIHIPFCVERCSYCDFLTFPHAEGLHDPYFFALLEQISRESDQRGLRGRLFDTVFLGGGSPDLLGADKIRSLFTRIRETIRLTEDAEITIELNPAGVSEEKVDAYKEVGINRISMGAQTANPDLLALCRRRHRPEDLEKDVQLLRAGGFDNISLDFIYAIPGQREEDIVEDLAVIKWLQPDHLSWYSLIVEERTLMKYWLDRGDCEAVGEDREMAMLNRIEEGLQALGYRKYETSNFARAGRESIHNSKYWTAKPYWGVGLGASSYLNRERDRVTRKLRDYIDRSPRGEQVWSREERSSEDDLFEQFMMGFRLVRGMNREDFRRRNGFSLLDYAPEFFEEKRAGGLVSWNEDYLALTPAGFRFQNDLLSDLLLYREKKLNKS